MNFTVDISPGELIDKITILEIKCARVSDPDQQSNLARQLGEFERVLREDVVPIREVWQLTEKLREINAAIWALEVEIRALIEGGDHGKRFVAVALDIVRRNDRRARIKSRINEALGSRIVEEKSYAY